MRAERNNWFRHFAAISLPWRRTKRPTLARRQSPGRLRRISRRQLAEARENRRAIRQVFVGCGAGLVLVCTVLLIRPRASPRQMVEALINRGKTVAPAKPAIPEAPVVADVLSSTNGNSGTSPSSAQTPVELTPARNETYLPVSFARLSSFRFKVTEEIADANANPALASEKTREQLPNTVKILSEKQVAITGFMLPIKVAGGLTTEFMILKNQSACCYGIVPQVNEWVIVHTRGKGVKPIMDIPVTAQGTLHVGEQRDVGHLIGIYLLDCDGIVNSRD